MTGARHNAIAPRQGEMPPKALQFAKLKVVTNQAGTPCEGESALAFAERLPAFDQRQFAKIRAIGPGARLSYFLSSYLLDVEFFLEEIRRARFGRNPDGIAQNAHILGNMTADIGATRASAAARRLEAACISGCCRQTDLLMDALSDCCAECEMELRDFLAGLQGVSDWGSGQ